MTRLQRLAATLERPLLVSKAANVRYLCGLESSNAYLLVRPDGDTSVYTDFRYAQAAKALDEARFEETARNVIGALAGLLAGQAVSFEADHLSYASYDVLATGGAELHPAKGAVERLRAVKDADELAAIRAAAALSDDVFAALAHESFVGRTEADLAWWIDRRFRELGASGSSFDTMVAFGEMGARPHGHPRNDVPIPSGTMVVVDAGCVVDGYCSDCTRTFLTGDDPRLHELYALCLQAQLDGLAAVRAGAQGRDVDGASRVAIDAAGLGAHYGHGLGHGVGMEIHEAPTLRPESEDTLIAGNVVTVEPGIYLEGDVGVRIEDLVVVGDDGCERLTTVTKDAIVVA